MTERIRCLIIRSNGFNQIIKYNAHERKKWSNRAKADIRSWSREISRGNYNT
jgi:hypothetical protein